MRSPAHTYIPDELRDKIPPLGATADDPDPTVWVTLYTPDSSWSWFITEYDGEDRCFGLVKGHETELGYFSLREIETVRGPTGLEVERDLWFTPVPLSAARA